MKNPEIPDKFTLINELSRRRGFFWHSYEIYGGVSGFVTYGPLGTKLKQNIEREIRSFFAKKIGVVEIESPVIAPAKVFEASGHVNAFKEPMVKCLDCTKRYRADHLLKEFGKIPASEAEKLSLKELQAAMKKSQIHCPECNGTFGKPKYFLTMFKTRIGPYSEAVGYGRPEAAQGIFVEFKRLYEVTRGKLPFGVLQVGHALRNEISPRQGVIRLREFTIIDLEFFFDPDEPNCFLLQDYENERIRLVLAQTKKKGSEEVTEVTVKEALEKKYVISEWQAVFMALAQKMLVTLGVPDEQQRFIEKLPWEQAHYALQSFDQEVYVERWGWIEVSGFAHRTDYDLRQHMKASGVDMHVFKEHEKPIEKEKLAIRPVMSKLGPIFKEAAETVIEMLAKVDPVVVNASLKKNGYFHLGKYKILPEHVEMMQKRVIEHGRRFLPHVVEPSFGSDRLFYVVLESAFKVKDDRKILSFPRNIAPMQISVFPLVNKDDIPQKASAVYELLLDEGFTVEYDDAGSIGRRYARSDEIGIPVAVTVDYDTLRNNTVTLRDRDSWRQVRSPVSNLPSLLNKYFSMKTNFEALGDPLEH